MNKLLKGLLVTALFAVGARAADTNKTFLMPRSHGVNMAMEYTTWNELVNMDKEDRFGANFQVIGFYQGSTDDNDRGKYFGVNDKNDFSFKQATGYDVYSPWVIHHAQANDAGVVAGDTANLKIDADQDAYGAKIFYYQDLEKILKGLYLKANLPIVHVQNDLNLKVSDPSGITSTNVFDYFKGSFTGLANGAQEKLAYSKIDGSQSTTSVADIDIALGYKFLDKENYHMSVNLGFTIPTGTKADGVYLWEPIVGNGKHWALGAGLDFGATLWDKDDQNIKLAIALNYRYLFSATEKRTIGLKGFTTSTNSNWAQYFLMGKTGGKVTPAANLLTRNVKVETGSQLDGIVEFAYNNGGFSIELGYNLFWKDSESVSLKDAWYADGTYGLIHEGYTVLADGNIVDGDKAWVGTAGTPGAVAATALANGAYQVNADKLNVDAAASESQVTNKIYGGLGYIFKEWEYPLLLGVGAQYEFASRDAVQNWGLWGKIGIGF